MHNCCILCKTCEEREIMRIKNVLSAVIPMALAVALVTGCGAKNGESANSAASKTANVTSSAKSSSTASKDSKTSREFDNLIRYEVHQSQIWLIFFVKS